MLKNVLNFAQLLIIDLHLSESYIFHFSFMRGIRSYSEPRRWLQESLLESGNQMEILESRIIISTFIFGYLVLSNHVVHQPLFGKQESQESIQESRNQAKNLKIPEPNNQSACTALFTTETQLAGHSKNLLIYESRRWLQDSFQDQVWNLESGLQFSVCSYMLAYIYLLQLT